MTLLERQTDFAREFRGEVLLPGGLDMFRQMGLWAGYERVPQVELREARLFVSGKFCAALTFDESVLGEVAPRWIAQASFLEWLVAEAGAFPSFRLERGVTVRDLLREQDRVVGVRAVGREGEREYRADLVVGGDGRSSVVRRRAGLPTSEDPVPMDIVWFKLPLADFFAQEPHSRIYAGGGHLLLVAPVADGNMQLAWVIPKGGFGRVKERGMQACLDEMAHHVSGDLAEHLRTTGAQAMDPFLLSTVSDRVSEWARPGLLVLGDAAHTMSPVGGQGLNHALRDAVVAANHLVPVFESGGTPGEIDRAAAAVQGEREPEVARIQSLQAVPPRILFRTGPLAAFLLRVSSFLLAGGWTPPIAGGVARQFFFGVDPVRLEV